AHARRRPAAPAGPADQARRQPAGGQEVPPAAGAAGQARRQRPTPHPPRHECAVGPPAPPRGPPPPRARLFNPVLMAMVLLAFLVVCWWVLLERGLAAAAHEAFDRPGLLLLVIAVTVFSAGFHEFGHAAAARRGGAVPGVMGAGIYLVWPAFSTDVTDSYRLGRAGRVRTDLGGLYFNAIVAV